MSGPGLGPNCLQRLSADDTSRQELISHHELNVCYLKTPPPNLITFANSLDPDQDRMSVLIWVQTVCKGYQQTTLVDKS